MDFAVRGPVGPAGMRHLEKAALVRSQAVAGARGEEEEEEEEEQGARGV